MAAALAGLVRMSVNLLVDVTVPRWRKLAEYYLGFEIPPSSPPSLSPPRGNSKNSPRKTSLRIF